VNIRMGEDWVLTDSQIRRFWAKVDIRGDDECWPWTGSLDGNGRPKLNVNGLMCIAARVCYVLTKGRIPDGLIVRHRCDNPPCCNPKHLVRGTTQDNMDDKVKRGRCPNGEDHCLSKLNTMQIAAIRGQFPKPDSILAKRFGVSVSTIQRVREGKTWKG
jgi:hypothetical protein